MQTFPLTIHIAKKFGQIKELGNELFDIVRIFVQNSPRRSDRMKLPISDVETIALQLNMKRGERL